MKRFGSIVATAAALVGILAGGLWWLSRSEAQSVKKNSATPQAKVADGPVASVKTVPIREGTITEDIIVNGTAIPAPDAVKTVSVPFECQVRRVSVSEGQEVSPGDILLEIEPSPDTYLQLQQERAAYQSAKEGLRQIQQQFNLRLKTNDQLLEAKQRLQQAELALESMKERGIAGPREIRADVAGLSSKVNVQEGAIVSAGNPLAEIIAQNRLEVRLGIELEDIDHVHSNQSVSLVRVNAPTSPAVTGRIRKVSRSVNPTTRLVDVFVTLAPSAEFLLGEYVFGTISIASTEGLIVPHTAVLPHEGENILFTVKEGRAVKHTVRLGLENKKELEVAGAGIQAGDSVVIIGNYELKDGMLVETEVSR